MNRRRAIVLSLAVTLPTLIAVPRAEAASGQAWVLRSRGDYNDARLDGTTLSPEGRISLAPSVERIADSPQPFVWCVAVDPEGRIHLGGGNEGQVYRIGPRGAELAFDAPEVEVHAIAFDRKGRLYAGASPPGRVYRIQEGSAGELFFDPNSTYVWALAFDGSGNLLVATGQPGRVYRVAPDGRGEVILDPREDHVRVLVPDGRGGFIAASDGSGIVYRISADGKATVLYDSPAREIAALAVVGGDVYAAALTPIPRAAPAAGEGRGPVTRVRVTAEGGSETQEGGDAQQEGTQQRPAQPAPESYAGAIYRITPQGYARKIWESRDVLPLSAMPFGEGRVLVGLSERGRLLTLTAGGDAGELASLEASQVSALIPAPEGGVLAGTSNLGAVWRVSAGFAREGTVLGGVRDAGFTSRWGAITWDADTPGGTEISFEVRTGDTGDPDETWSDWSRPSKAAPSLIDRPPARYLQWRATLKSAGDVTPVLRSVQVHYQPENMPPEVESVDVLNPGIFLQPVGPPSGNGEGGEGQPRRSTPSKRSFQRGMRSVSWKTSDANNDLITAEVQYKAEDETVWKTLKSGIEEDFFAWDSTAMPDGVYRLRVVVGDERSNPRGGGLTGMRESAPFDVDNTPPLVTDVVARRTEKAAEVSAVVADTFSVVGEVAYSVDAAEWTVVLPEDGVADSTREVIRFSVGDLPKGEHSIVVRARDRAGNSAAGKVLVKVP